MCWGLARNRLRRAAAFTLVELVIAATITSFLGAVVYLAFVQGLRVWRRAALDRPAEDMELALEHVSLDLRNALPSGRAPFVGKRSSMAFDAMAGGAGDASAGAAMPARISYAFDSSDKVLRMSRQSLREMLMLKPPLPAERSVARAVRWEAQYYDAPAGAQRGTWKNSWQASCLPNAVKISAEVEGSGGKARKLTRLIPVPAGGCLPAEATA